MLEPDQAPLEGTEEFADELFDESFDLEEGRTCVVPPCGCGSGACSSRASWEERD